MNAMVALYHIPQSESPTLKRPAKWHADFVNFVNSSLHKEPKARPSAATLLNVCQHTVKDAKCHVSRHLDN